ncbi:aminopeptidase [Lysinibacillus sp. FSL H8-0500]|uniref:aminopeptidase n=1 Tax=Lysinibacillus sp. FSL H8-0500 TaxID=2921393 RepID=UPI0031010D58
MKNFEDRLDKYAELVIKVGINIQQGQILVISASITAADFVRKVCRYAYLNGAHYVYVKWNDEKLLRLECELMSEQGLEYTPDWLVKGYEEMANEGAAFLYILSPHLQDIKGIDPARLDKMEYAAAMAFRPFTEKLTSMQVSWTVIALPTEAWAATIFPKMEPNDGLERLWEELFKILKLDSENPILAWEQHMKRLNKRAALLNDMYFRYLHFKAEGTDLTIELPQHHHWVHGMEKNNNGIPFICNIPTEEIYTTPLKTGVNGVVKNTRPLVYDGQIIDDFTFIFKDGKIIDYTTKNGLDALQGILKTDEGAKYIGEVALVSHDSAISASNLMFYHALFDENASCHLAIGQGYISGLQEEHRANDASSINSSMIHIDFMIGSEHLHVNGISEDGSVKAILVNGKWETDFNI